MSSMSVFGSITIEYYSSWNFEYSDTIAACTCRALNARNARTDTVYNGAEDMRSVRKAFVVYR